MESPNARQLAGTPSRAEMTRFPYLNKSGNAQCHVHHHFCCYFRKEQRKTSFIPVISRIFTVAAVSATPFSLLLPTAAFTACCCLQHTLYRIYSLAAGYTNKLIPDDQTLFLRWIARLRRRSIEPRWKYRRLGDDGALYILGGDEHAPRCLCCDLYTP